ncbi:MAG TPA: protein kinase [Bryobacteraceae bacterium]|jgi:tetratricopeptide (TPR) repeat protein|nr:protein kinase [Bryobacteraceae bacterium]
MQAKDWQKIKDLFSDLADSSAFERQTQLSGVDPSIRQEVECMLESHDLANAGDGILEKSALQVPNLLDLLGEPQVFHSGDLLLDRFEIRRLIGRGGMGEVYEALDTQHPKLVAIKTIRFDLRWDDRIRERFHLEVQRSRQISHPNVCRVHELFTVSSETGPDTPFFSMELLQGETLFERVRRSGPPPVDEAITITQQICEGLHAAHRCGIVHRDLKSSNIILVRTAEDVCAKITDFGLAREMPSDGDSIVSLAGSSLAGTLTYMAPELLEGRTAAIPSDLYALGVLLYRMVTGRYPFEAEGDLISAAMRLRHAAPSPRRFVPTIPRSWERAILACLSGDPELRPADALAVADLFRDLPLARWTWGMRVTKARMKRRKFLLGGCLVAAGAAGGFFWQRWQPPPFARRPAKVLIEDFESADPGGVLGRATRNMVKIALFHSQNLRLLPPREVAGALNALNVGAVPLRGETALRVARKAGADISIRGKLTSAGSRFQIHMEAVQPDDGRVLAATDAVAETQGHLAPAVEAACSHLHESLVGGIRMAGQGISGSVESADTLSPDALEMFTGALSLYQYGEISIALSYLENAVKLDPDFAMAYVYKATIHGALRRDDLAFESISRAFELRNRVNDRQRRQTEAMYRNFCGDYAKALDQQRVLVNLYPNEASLQRQIAQTYALLDQPAEGLRHGRQAVDLEPGGGVNYMVLASILAQLGRFPEALQVVGTGKQKVANSPVLLSTEGIVKIIQGDYDGAMAALRQLETRPNYAAHARSHMIRCLLLRGDLDEARSLLDSDRLLTQMDGDLAHEDLSRYWLGGLANLRGDRRETEEQARHLLERPAQPYNLFALRSAAELAYESHASRELAATVGKIESIQKRYPGTRSTGILLQSRGLLAALSGRTAEAKRLLTEARAAWPDISNTWTAAQFFVTNGTFAEALPLYQSVAARKGSAIRWEQQIQWVRSLAQAARCYRAMGREQEAFDSYDRYLNHWGKAASLALTKQVLAERHGSTWKE